MSYTTPPAPGPIVALGAGKKNSQTVYGNAKAAGSITFAGQPDAADTVTINGIVFTAVAADAEAYEFVIGADLGASIDNLVTEIEAAEDDELADIAVANSGDTILTVTSTVDGSEGNEITIAASVATASGATLTGGVSSDVIDLSIYSLIQFKTLSSEVNDFTLPDGVYDGQKIALYFHTKGANAKFTGVFVDAVTDITFDTAGDYAELIWLGGSWMPVVIGEGVRINSGAVSVHA